MARIADIAAYFFISLDDRAPLLTRLQEAHAARHLLVTILLAHAGGETRCGYCMAFDDRNALRPDLSPPGQSE